MSRSFYLLYLLIFSNSSFCYEYISKDNANKIVKKRHSYEDSQRSNRRQEVDNSGYINIDLKSFIQNPDDDISLGFERNEEERYDGNNIQKTMRAKNQIELMTQEPREEPRLAEKDRNKYFKKPWYPFFFHKEPGKLKSKKKRYPNAKILKHEVTKGVTKTTWVTEPEMSTESNTGLDTHLHFDPRGPYNFFKINKRSKLACQCGDCKDRNTHRISRDLGASQKTKLSKKSGETKKNTDTYNDFDAYKEHNSFQMDREKKLKELEEVQKRIDSVEIRLYTSTTSTTAKPVTR